LYRGTAGFHETQFGKHLVVGRATETPNSDTAIPFEQQLDKCARIFCDRESVKWDPKLSGPIYCKCFQHNTESQFCAPSPHSKTVSRYVKNSDVASVLLRKQETAGSNVRPETS